MIYRRDSIPKGEAWKGAFIKEPIQSSTQRVSNQDVEKGRERAPLPNPSGSFEEFGGSPIDERGYPRGGDASLNMVNEDSGEAKSLHHHDDEGMS